MFLAGLYLSQISIPVFRLSSSILHLLPFTLLSSHIPQRRHTHAYLYLYFYLDLDLNLNLDAFVFTFTLPLCDQPPPLDSTDICPVNVIPHRR